MTITEHTHGAMLTLSMEFGTMKGRLSATLSGHTRCAIIDGLLWWALNRKLDALVAACMPLPIHASMEHAQALHEGERLVHYVHYTPWHMEEEKRQLKVCTTVDTHIPELAPLAALGPDHQREYQELKALATLLRSRIQHPGEAYHGLEGIIVSPSKQAA